MNNKFDKLYIIKSIWMVIALLTLVLLTMFSCCQNTEMSKIIIKPLNPYSATPHYYDSADIKSRSFIVKYYFIHGACKVTNELTEKVDSYVLKSLQENDKDFDEFGSYQIELYRQTDKLNDNFRENVDGMFTNDMIDYYKDDLLYKYIWSDKKFEGCTIYKDGKEVDNYISKKIK